MVDKWRLDSNKLLWHLARVDAYFKHAERVPPLLIDIGATKLCNVRCVYCYGQYQKMDNHTIIPPDILIKLFKDAPQLGVKALTLTGDGEPTLNPGMCDACTAGKEHGLDIGIATNGVALTVDMIENILNTCVWCRFNISAGTKGGYKKVHGVDQFDRVVTNIRTMVDFKRMGAKSTTIGLQMVLVPDCLDEILPLSQLAIDLKVDYFVIKQFSDPQDSNIQSSGLHHEEFIKKAMPILKQAEGLSNNHTAIIPKYNIMKLHNERSYPHCIDAPFIFQVSGNGRCYPCGFLFNHEEWCYGDLHKQSLKEIITSDRYWNLVKRLARTSTRELCPRGCCRHDSTNRFLHNYINPPQHLNFI